MGFIISITAALRRLGRALVARRGRARTRSLITVTIVIVASALKILSHYLPGRRS